MTNVVNCTINIILYTHSTIKVATIKIHALFLFQYTSPDNCRCSPRPSARWNPIPKQPQVDSKVPSTRAGLRITALNTQGKTASETTTPVETDPSQNIIQADIIRKRNMTHNIFCCAALADKNTETFCTDPTSTLPVQLLDGIQYYFVAYDYNTKYSFAIFILDAKDDTLIEAIDTVFGDINDRVLNPQLDVTDNQDATRPKETHAAIIKSVSEQYATVQAPPVPSGPLTARGCGCKKNNTVTTGRPLAVTPGGPEHEYLCLLMLVYSTSCWCI